MAVLVALAVFVEFSSFAGFFAFAVLAGFVSFSAFVSAGLTFSVGFISSLGFEPSAALAFFEGLPLLALVFFSVSGAAPTVCSSVVVFLVLISSAKVLILVHNTHDLALFLLKVWHCENFFLSLQNIFPLARTIISRMRALSVCILRKRHLHETAKNSEKYYQSFQ